MCECISLVTAIFLDCDQVEVVENLCGDDAQAFIDVIDEASTCTFTSGGQVG